MLGRPETPKQGNTIATLALLLLMSGFALPVLAAPDRDILCDDEHHEATLDITAAELVARPASHDLEAQKNQDTETASADQLLKPRFDATVREVFAEDEEEENVKEAEVVDPAALRIRVPGVSDEELVRFKRQMYRRDI